MLFNSVTLHWHNKSWVHKTRSFVHEKAKIGSTSNSHFSMPSGPLITILNYIMLYYSALKLLYSLIGLGKGNLTQEDNIFADPKFGLSKHHISVNYEFS